MSIPPGTRRRQQQLARWVRSAPGYRTVTSAVLPRLRSSATLTDLVWRVLTPRQGIGQTAMPLHAGRHLSGASLDRLPVVGVLATGLNSDEAEQLIDTVAALQHQAASFRPLLILDQPLFATARAHGYVLEHLVPQEAFTTGDYGDPDGWGVYVGTRLGEIIHHYQLLHIARGSARGLDPLDEHLLRALASRLPADLDVSPTPDSRKAL